MQFGFYINTYHGFNALVGKAIHSIDLRPVLEVDVVGDDLGPIVTTAVAGSPFDEPLEFAGCVPAVVSAGASAALVLEVALEGTRKRFRTIAYRRGILIHTGSSREQVIVLFAGVRRHEANIFGDLTPQGLFATAINALVPTKIRYRVVLLVI
jgi:hypothetical protein